MVRAVILQPQLLAADPQVVMVGERDCRQRTVRIAVRAQQSSSLPMCDALDGVAEQVRDADVVGVGVRVHQVSHRRRLAVGPGCLTDGPL
jgi:hypothetical protein